MRQMFVDLQQTAIKLHAITNSTHEKDHDADACKCGVSPEMIWNQRRTIVLNPKVHPVGKCWHGEKSNNEQYYLRSFANIVNVSRQHSGLSLSVSQHTSKGGEGSLTPTHRTTLLVRYWQ